MVKVEGHKDLLQHVEHLIVAAEQNKAQLPQSVQEYTTALKMLHTSHLRHRTELEKVHKELSQMRQRVAAQTKEGRERLCDIQRILNLEVVDRVRAEQALIQRHQALEALYTIATDHSASLDTTFERIVTRVASLLAVPFTAIQRRENTTLHAIAQYCKNGSFINDGQRLPLRYEPCGDVVRKAKPIQYSGNLKETFPHSVHLTATSYRSYIGVPIIDDTGEVRGVLMALDEVQRTFDQTEIHLLEIFARYAAYEYTRLRLETQVRQDDEMRLLGQLTSGVAHEVRNPLNAIGAIVEALSKELGDNPTYRPYREHIQKQVQRLSLLMEELLMLGRPVKASDFQEHSIELLITHAIELFKHGPFAQNNEIRFIKPRRASAWLVSADSAKIQQVFLNLLENAVVHSPKNADVCIVLDKTGDRTLRIRIVDRGSGIAVENIARVFDPFFTTRKNGTGLGLTIVRRLIESHNGQVVIYNNEHSVGCTVEIRLPRSVSSDCSPYSICHPNRSAAQQ